MKHDFVFCEDMDFMEKLIANDDLAGYRIIRKNDAIVAYKNSTDNNKDDEQE